MASTWYIVFIEPTAVKKNDNT